MTKNVANRLFNSIGVGTLNIEKTSVGLIEPYVNLNLENKFKIPPGTSLKFASTFLPSSV